ncbi:hypothetical protein OG819_39460 [Streptomyces sp. NBC_01549]|uniref:hypothetical protein n=1 Tax=Streptomyces sp. NBC_01549 TaxID=2975874 RepID=UPI0022572569|nr:hypothetical protein [Streptomyces sp. NBC_01549]MCX4595534.1 hypothetical protein [Streptomyces sp. NBC_01549]
METDTRAGRWLAVWIDRRGRLVSMPLTPGKAAFQATWAGALVGVGTAGAVIGAPRSRVPALSGRRLQQWVEEWARIDTR